ncbi:MAG: hypothetical protein EBZ50_02305 [Alphaproteobacteria bacterium]|nr:hypothetical protein [Alphaproteobacteria bacterium]
MKHVIKAGTDGAMLCAFDPAALPADIDAALGDDPVGAMTALATAGRLWFGDADGDGAFGVHVIIDDAGESDAAPRDAQSLYIPSGELWVCGAEYLARDPRIGHAFTPKGGLGRYDMGRRIDLAPGRYALHVSALDAREAGARAMTSAHWLQAAPMLMVLLGGFAAVVLGLASLAIVAITAVRVLSGDPNAAANVGKLWGLPAAALAGAGLALIGDRIGKSVAASPAVARANASADADKMANPDFIFRLQRIGDVAA